MRSSGARDFKTPLLVAAGAHEELDVGPRGDDDSNRMVDILLKAKANVNGGSIAIGQPFGMTGSRMDGHVLIEGQRRKAKNVVARGPASAVPSLSLRPAR